MSAHYETIQVTNPDWDPEDPYGSDQSITTRVWMFDDGSYLEPSKEGYGIWQSPGGGGFPTAGTKGTDPVTGKPATSDGTKWVADTGTSTPGQIEAGKDGWSFFKYDKNGAAIYKNTDGTYAYSDRTTADPNDAASSGGLGDWWKQLQTDTGLTTPQILGLSGGAAALLAAGMNKPQTQDDINKANNAQREAVKGQMHTPINIENIDDSTRSFDPYGSISVAPVSRTQIAYTGNPTGYDFSTNAASNPSGTVPGMIPPVTKAAAHGGYIQGYADGGYVDSFIPPQHLATGGLPATIQGAGGVTRVVNPDGTIKGDDGQPMTYNGGVMTLDANGNIMVSGQDVGSIVNGRASFGNINLADTQASNNIGGGFAAGSTGSAGLTSPLLPKTVISAAGVQRNVDAQGHVLDENGMPMQYNGQALSVDSIGNVMAGSSQVGQLIDGRVHFGETAPLQTVTGAAGITRRIASDGTILDEQGKPMSYTSTGMTGNLKANPDGTVSQNGVVVGTIINGQVYFGQPPTSQRTVKGAAGVVRQIDPTGQALDENGKPMSWTGGGDFSGTPLIVGENDVVMQGGKQVGYIAQGQIHFGAPPSSGGGNPYVPTTPAPSPAGGSSTVNTLPTAAPMDYSRSLIPFKGDWLHYGEGPEHLFYDKVNPLYGGPGSVYDLSVTGENQKPTVSNETLDYVPPTAPNPSLRPTIPSAGTNAFTSDIAHGQTNPGQMAWWNYNNPNSMVPNASTTGNVTTNYDANGQIIPPTANITGTGQTTSGPQLTPSAANPYWNAKLGTYTPQPSTTPGVAYAQGGPALGGLSALQGQRMQGHIRGPGTGQSDSIPAVLSNGEYVMDADSVAALGDGSTEAGAKALDGMRHAIRKHKRSAPITSIPPKAKAPMAYLKGGKA